MVIFWPLAAYVILSSQFDTAAVIGLGDAKETYRRALKIAKSLADASTTVLSGAETKQRLCGPLLETAPDIEGLRRMLAAADEHEARFDTELANSLRTEVLKIFDLTMYPSASLRALAAESAYALAASFLIDNQKRKAINAARTAVRRFNEHVLDSTRFNPVVMELFTSARQLVENESRLQLEVVTTVPGNLFVEGILIGPIADKTTLNLSLGQSRLWIETANGKKTFTRIVDFNAHNQTIAFEPDLDEAITFGSIISLSCRDDCASILYRLGLRLKVNRLIGVSADGFSSSGDLVVDTAKNDVAVFLPPVSAAGRISAWSFAPFGIGQFVQKRPVVGSALAAGEAGLLVWHLLAWQKHNTILDTEQFSKESNSRRNRNLSAGLFYSLVAFGIAEALITDYFVR